MVDDTNFGKIHPYKVWKCVCGKTKVTKTGVTAVLCPDCDVDMIVVYMTRSTIHGIGCEDSDLNLGLELLVEAAKDVEIH
jgi:hypothetical protein